MSSAQMNTEQAAHELRLIRAAERQEFDYNSNQKRIGSRKTADMLPRVGSSIGAYRTVRKLGEGGMGAA